MDGEGFEAKVQSMPQELQKTFRESLEISLSKRIVNRFMSVVMQAYAQGQRAYAQNDDAYSRGYEKGSDDMRATVHDILAMTSDERKKYFGISDVWRFDEVLDCIMLLKSNEIYSKTAAYKASKQQDEEKKAHEVDAVKALADVIGIHRLYAIACEIRGEPEGDEGELPL